MARKNNATVNNAAKSSKSATANATMTVAKAYAMINAMCDDEDVLDIDERKTVTYLSASADVARPSSVTLRIIKAVGAIVGGSGASVWNANKSRYEIPAAAWAKAGKARDKAGVTAEKKPAKQTSTQKRIRVANVLKVYNTIIKENRLSKAAKIALDDYVDALEDIADAQEQLKRAQSEANELHKAFVKYFDDTLYKSAKQTKAASKSSTKRTTSRRAK